MSKKQIDFNKVRQVSAINQEVNTKGEVIEKNVYTSIVLPEELYIRLKIYATLKGITVKDFFDFHIEAALTNGINENISKAPKIEDYFKINLYTTESKRKNLKVYLSKNKISMRDFIFYIIQKYTEIIE